MAFRRTPVPHGGLDTTRIEHLVNATGMLDENEGESMQRREPPAVSGASGHPISFREAVRVWAKVGLNSFGGPAGQIAVMHRMLVEERHWISEKRFLHALNYCMLLPGPEAQQLAVYIGWLLHRVRGGLAAGILFVLPGVLTILGLSIVYAQFGKVEVVVGLFFGLKPAVLAVVLEAVLRIGRRALKNGWMVGLAALAFIAIFFFDVPFPLIVLGAGMIGLAGGRLAPDQFAARSSEAEVSGEDASVVDRLFAAGLLEHVRPSLRRAIWVLVIGLALWFGPLLLVAAVFGPQSIYVQEGVFFSKTAVVTFGGAYAVLAYVAQRAVESFQWLGPGEMLDGLGMAETTPGPLIMVLQFVGFMAAWRNCGTLSPLAAGTLGGLLTTWVTFVPCFMWIFLGAPYIESLRGNRAISAALSAITAAVVGVILNLAVWFALHTLFGSVRTIWTFGMRLQVPVWETVDPYSVGIAVLAVIAIFRWKLGMLPTLGGSAVLGAVLYLLWR